jgi:hypothetical protein
MWSLSTPVVFIIFNRPDVTQRVFNVIARAKPSKLLVIADGPRDHKSGEAEKCYLTRAIIHQVNWQCEVLTNYSDENLGCKERIVSGLNWAFKEVEEAIILEDDCLPDPSFFRFCSDMLERYRHDKRIGMISGDNFLPQDWISDSDYYFSRYSHIWGWATWRRAWVEYDPEILTWPSLREENWLKSLALENSEQQYWGKMFDKVHAAEIDTWDYQWVFTCWLRGMLSVMPKVNLISNIGFGKDATHTKGGSIYANLPTQSIQFPLKENEVILPNLIADNFTAKNMFTLSISRRIYRRFIAPLFSRI